MVMLLPALDAAVVRRPLVRDRVEFGRKGLALVAQLIGDRHKLMTKQFSLFLDIS